MIDQLQEHLVKVAAEKFPNNAEAADMFVNAFLEKAAALFGGPTLGQTLSANAPHMYEAGARALGVLGVGLAGAAIAKGLVSGGKAIDMSALRRRFESSLATVMANNKIVKAYPPDKVKSYAETIFRFAPRVAADPNLLASLLANSVQGEGIDPMTIKTLTELEAKYADANKPAQIPRIG